MKSSKEQRRKGAEENCGEKAYSKLPRVGGVSIGIRSRDENLRTLQEISSGRALFVNRPNPAIVSLCVYHLAEAWQKRRYAAAFVLKLNDSEAEATETQTWIEFAIRYSYLDPEKGTQLHQTYDHILGKLVWMIINPSPWLILARNRPT